jgi:hypothetical protein
MLECWSVLVLVKVVVFVGSVKLESETLRKSVTYLIYIYIYIYMCSTLQATLHPIVPCLHTRVIWWTPEVILLPHSYGRRIVTAAEAGLMLSNDTTDE